LNDREIQRLHETILKYRDEIIEKNEIIGGLKMSIRRVEEEYNILIKKYEYIRQENHSNFAIIDNDFLTIKALKEELEN